MKTGSFWKGLAGVVLITMAILWVLDLLLPASKAIGILSLLTSVIFIGIVIAAFYLGQMAVRSASKARFIQLVMMIIIVKMFVCVLIVAVYLKLVAPASKLFVVPFLAIYLIFTIFEVVVLDRIARFEHANGKTDQ